MSYWRSHLIGKLLSRNHTPIHTFIIRLLLNAATMLYIFSVFLLSLAFIFQAQYLFFC